MHGDEYRARDAGLQPGLTVEDPRRRVGELEAHEGFDVTLGHHDVVRNLTDLAGVGL